MIALDRRGNTFYVFLNHKVRNERDSRDYKFVER